VLERGWYTWADQQSYLWMAQDMAEGKLVNGRFLSCCRGNPLWLPAPRGRGAMNRALLQRLRVIFLK